MIKPLSIGALIISVTAAQAGQMTVACQGTYTSNCANLSTSYCIELTGDTQGTSFNALQRMRIYGINSQRTVVAGEATVTSEQVNGATVVRVLVPAPAAMYNDQSNADYVITNCQVFW